MQEIINIIKTIKKLEGIDSKFIETNINILKLK